MKIKFNILINNLIYYQNKHYLIQEKLKLVLIYNLITLIKFLQ